MHGGGGKFYTNPRAVKLLLDSFLEDEVGRSPEARVHQILIPLQRNCSPACFRDSILTVNQRLITEIGKSQRLRIVNRLKRTQGLSVGELSNLLDMSYMGIKQHCLDLERLGYLDTWRRPKAATQTGRPELVYRLTPKAHELFPVTSNATTLQLLEAAQALYGAAAPEKLLFLLVRRKTEDYQAKVKGETLKQRAESFAALRDAEGYLTEVEEDEAGLRMVEYHNPQADLLAAHPALLPRLEQEMVARVLRVPVKREQTTVSGHYVCIFRVG